MDDEIRYGMVRVGLRDFSAPVSLSATELREEISRFEGALADLEMELRRVEMEGAK